MQKMGAMIACGIVIAVGVAGFVFAIYEGYHELSRIVVHMFH